MRLDLLGGGGHIPSGAPGPSVEAVRRRFGHRSSGVAVFAVLVLFPRLLALAGMPYR